MNGWMHEAIEKMRMRNMKRLHGEKEKQRKE